MKDNKIMTSLFREDLMFSITEIGMKNAHSKRSHLSVFSWNDLVVILVFDICKNLR